MPNNNQNFRNVINTFCDVRSVCLPHLAGLNDAKKLVVFIVATDNRDLEGALLPLV